MTTLCRSALRYARPMIDSTRGARDPIRLGIMGLGAVAQSVYLPLLARLPERFAVSAVADLSASTLDAVATHHGVPERARHRQPEAMIDAGGLDAVVVLTSGSHAEIAGRALDAGLAVLCEKPLAYTHAAVDALEATLQRTDGRLQLGYMKQYDPAVTEAARVIRERASQLGALRAAEVTVLHPTSESQLAFAHVLSPPTGIGSDTRVLLQGQLDAERVTALGPAAAELGALYTDILLGSVVHDLVVLRHLAADPVAIDGVETWPPGAWPPSVGISGWLAGGARLTIGWHYLPGYPAYREDVRLHFDRGSVELCFPVPYRLYLPTRLDVTVGGGETIHRTRTASIAEAFEQQLLAFEALVRDDAAPLADTVQGRRDIVTCQAIASRLAAGRGLELGGEAATHPDRLETYAS